MEKLSFKYEQMSLFDLPLLICEQEVVTQEEKVDWSDDAINELRYSMIVIAVKEIRDLRKSKAMRKEAWDWLFDDECCSPFSAPVCAKCTGYDIEELRRLLLRLVPSL